MTTEIYPAALIIAYRRKENLSSILRLCEKNNVERIYIALDGPKASNQNGRIENNQMKDLISNFRSSFEGQVKILNHQNNVGCAAAVLSACDWVFETEEYAIILEDDCIPSDDFFLFARKTLSIMKTNTQVWLSCGTQFVPTKVQCDSWFLSKYPLTWGWATTKDNWRSISNSIRGGYPLARSKGLPFIEDIYWRAGARRAYEGYTDVWDTILAHRMQIEHKFSILPDVALVSNIGNDQAATHTKSDSRWLNIETGKFLITQKAPVYRADADVWLRRRLYRISLRHLVTTQLTRFIDGTKKVESQKLLARWNRAKTTKVSK
jgi:hypothetical protein